MTEPSYRACMCAEMKPNLYGGKNCDEQVPGWSCYADGDKQGEDNLDCLELAAKTFPPGTKVIVKEPCCPDCGDPRWPNNIAGETTFPAKCDCGFDWEAWVANEYS